MDAFLASRNNEKEMKIESPIEWDEKDNFELPAKGWLDDIKVINENGKEY